MSVPAMLRRAGAITLLVYAMHTLAACVLGAPLGSDFAGAVSQNLYRAQLDPGDAALVLELGARRLPGLLTWSAVCAIAYALLAPLLQVSWTRAMTRSSTIRTCLAHGLRRYPAALALGVFALIAWGAALIAFMAALAAVTTWLPPSVAGEHSARAVCVLLGALAWLLLSTLHDLAIAALAHDLTHDRLPTLRALTAARRALSTPALAAHALLALAIAACFVAAEAISRNALLSTSPTLLLALQQPLVFAATLLRATWLATALTHLEHSSSKP